MAKFVSSVILMLCLTSCLNNTNSTSGLEDKVMAIHDEVMPKMSLIHASKKELAMALKAGADSTQTLQLLDQLNNADDAMMTWMDEYIVPDEKAPLEERTKYLDQELIRIQDVKTKMLKAIADVEKFTAQFKLEPTETSNDTAQ